MCEVPQERERMKEHKSGYTEVIAKSSLQQEMLKNELLLP